MAYPTNLSFAIVDPVIGVQPITATSTVQNHALGKIVHAKEFGAGYGEGEFIYLKGVASTAAGDCVVYDAKAGTTTRSVATSQGNLAVAMSANVANQYGWYQISGEAVVNTTLAGTGAANPNLSVTATPGQLTVASTGATPVHGAVCKTAQDTPSAGYTQVQLSRPFVPGFTTTQP